MDEEAVKLCTYLIQLKQVIISDMDLILFEKLYSANGKAGAWNLVDTGAWSIAARPFLCHFGYPLQYKRSCADV